MRIPHIVGFYHNDVAIIATSLDIHNKVDLELLWKATRGKLIRRSNHCKISCNTAYFNKVSAD